MNVKQVTELFVEQGLIDHAQAEDLEQEVLKTGKSLAQVMVDFGVCTEVEFYQEIAQSLGTEYVDISAFDRPRSSCA